MINSENDAKTQYENEENRHIKVARGTKDDYFVMTLHHSQKGVPKVYMKHCIRNIEDKFSYPIKNYNKITLDGELFKVDDSFKK